MRYFLAGICILVLGLSAWAQDIVYEGEGNGQLMLSVTEFNVKKKEAVAKSIQDAYFQILFRGIPTSKICKKALLGTDESIVERHQQYFDEMIKQGRLYSFVTYSNLTYYKKKEAVVILTINIDALISDLEQKHLYKRFGLH